MQEFANERLLDIFQFHYGTIKSSSSTISYSQRSKFQFHYGTIKSIRGIYVLAYVRDFNSTMVRLKAGSGYYPACSPLFQFHYGTIKS